MIEVQIMSKQGGRQKTLARLKIINDETGTEEVGNYSVLYTLPNETGAVATRLDGFDRSRGATELGLEALSVVKKVLDYEI